MVCVFLIFFLNLCVHVLIEGLLLVSALAEGKEEVQKIVSFEGAFEKMFRIISSEGYMDGGVIVYDCISCMYNLLASNESNQKYFREIGCFPSLSEVVDIRDRDMSSISPLTVKIVNKSLSIVSILLNPDSSEAEANKVSVNIS